MLDLRYELGMGARVFISSDHSNNKGLHHLVKALSMWSNKDNCEKIIRLDIDASGGTSDDTVDGIDVSLSKLDTYTKRIPLTGQCDDAGGRGIGNSLMEGLRTRYVQYPNTYHLHVQTMV